MKSDDVSVLVVNDEIALTGVVGSYLARAGFTVSIAHTGPEVVLLARANPPIIIILDLMLPGFDGVEVCRQIRQFSDAYIIMLTARDQEADKVLGLSMGADDYLIKPFSPRELIARVRAMLRRPRFSSADHPEVLTLGGGILVVDTHARTVTLNDAAVELTRRQLISEVWSESWYGDEHIVDVHIGHLRTKLSDHASDPHFIRTVRGVGYGLFQLSPTSPGFQLGSYKRKSSLWAWARSPSFLQRYSLHLDSSLII